MSNEIQFILYNLPDEEGKVQVVIKDETIWCTQKAMARLFGIDKSGISRHIANIFKEEELQQDTTVAKIATVVNRGIRGEVEEQVDFYNLDNTVDRSLLHLDICAGPAIWYAWFVIAAAAPARTMPAPLNTTKKCHKLWHKLRCKQ